MVLYVKEVCCLFLFNGNALSIRYTLKIIPNFDVESKLASGVARGEYKVLKSINVDLSHSSAPRKFRFPRGE